MYPLGYIIKAGEINSNDLIKSLIEVFSEYGLPNKRVIVDNGIGRAEAFLDFLDNMRAKAGYSEPYTPTNKALIEGTFGLFKKEFDSFFTNFVGPDKRRESRHTSLSLSPEKTDTSFEEYKSNFENYINSFFIERLRDRVIGGKRAKISIKEHFNKEYLTHKKNEVSGSQIRLALSRKDTAVWKNKIIFKREQYISTRNVFPELWNVKVAVLYNPFNYDEVDIFALCDIGKWRKGDKIDTLINVRNKENKRVIIEDIRKRINKTTKELAENIVANIEELSVDEILTPTCDGEKLIERRKAARKRTQKIINAELINKIDKKYLDEFSQLTETKAAALTYSEEVNERSGSDSLTYD